MIGQYKKGVISYIPDYVTTQFVITQLQNGARLWKTETLKSH